MLDFETTHEYYLRGPHLYYCEDHGALIIRDGDHEDRILIRGFEAASILKFATEIYKESIEAEIKKDEELYEEVKKADPIDIGLE
tara:strand:- start:323 stop:577 length:255 start_codon:yes stop_codon:yes gene_type:complete